MQVFQFIEAANDYSVPFDWDDNDDNIDYIQEVVDRYFDENKRVGGAWRPSFFGVVNKKQKVGELGTLSGGEMVIFSQRAVDVLAPLIENSVELLAYPTELGTYYLVNVLDEGEYLNRQLTDCDKILPNGRCYGINKFVFQPEKLADKHLFHIPDDGVTRYVSGEFIAACRQHKLYGICLDDSVKVWDSNAS